MFGTYRFHDEVGYINPGFVLASFSASGKSSGGIIDASKFRKFVFRLYAEGIQNANKSITLYSCSTSASSISSASSNWAQIDSASCIVTMLSASAAVSSNQYVATLEVRGERLHSASAGTRWIRPVLACGSGVASNAIDSCYLICDAVLPHYGTGSSVESPAYSLTTETDYL